MKAETFFNLFFIDQSLRVRPVKLWAFSHQCVYAYTSSTVVVSNKSLQRDEFVQALLQPKPSQVKSSRVYSIGPVVLGKRQNVGLYSHQS